MNLNVFQFSKIDGCVKLHVRKFGLLAVFNNKSLKYVQLTDKQAAQDKTEITCRFKKFEGEKIYE